MFTTFFQVRPPNNYKDCILDKLGALTSSNICKAHDLCYDLGGKISTLPERLHGVQIGGRNASTIYIAKAKGESLAIRHSCQLYGHIYTQHTFSPQILDIPTLSTRAKDYSETIHQGLETLYLQTDFHKEIATARQEHPAEDRPLAKLK